jgi:hypothetical protein
MTDQPDAGANQPDAAADPVAPVAANPSPTAPVAVAADPPAASPNTPDSSEKAQISLVVGKSTDKFYAWQQIPAWVLGGAAIVGGGLLIAFPKNQSNNAWVAVIVALFLAALMSYRSAFTLNDDGPAGTPNANGGAPDPNKNAGTPDPNPINPAGAG